MPPPTLDDIDDIDDIDDGFAMGGSFLNISKLIALFDAGSKKNRSSSPLSDASTNSTSVRTKSATLPTPRATARKWMLVLFGNGTYREVEGRGLERRSCTI